MSIARPRHLVLVTDDDPTTRGVLNAVLADEFDIIEAASGEECLTRIASHEPALVLLDIEMPGIDGYETCRRLRLEHDMPVIVVSSHDTLEERLRAFAAGADDFISKPFDGEDVLFKVERLMGRHLQLAKIREEQAALQEFALELVRGIGRKDVLLDFMRENMHCVDYETLAAHLLQATDEYSVRCHVQIRTEQTAYTLTPSGPASPLEVSVFEQCASLGPTFAFGRRLIVNCGDVSLLVLRLPDDEETSERIQGKLTVLTEFAAAVAETIHVRQESAQRAEALQSGTADSYTAIEDLREKYRAQQTDTRFLLQRLIDDVEESYVHLGLTTGQEESLSTTLRERSEDILQLFELQEEFEEKFAAILESLQPKSADNSSAVWLF